MNNVILFKILLTLTLVLYIQTITFFVVNLLLGKKKKEMIWLFKQSYVSFMVLYCIPMLLGMGGVYMGILVSKKIFIILNNQPITFEKITPIYAIIPLALPVLFIVISTLGIVSLLTKINTGGIKNEKKPLL